MIVLKATQDKVLCVLLSVAGIIERRHTLPILANVLLRKIWPTPFGHTSQAVANPVLACSPLLTLSARRGGSSGVTSRLRPKGFFSASKANLRNAP